MDILKKANTARIVMVLMIIFSTFLGSRNTLQRLTRTAEEIFWNGAYGNGMGIAYDIDNNLSIAYNLQTVASRYLDSSDSAMEDLASAIDIMTNAETIGDMAKGNEVITEAVLLLTDKLLTLELSEADYSYTTGFIADLAGNNTRIAKDPYNEKAAEVNVELNSFPAAILRIPTGIDKLTLFT